MNNGTLETAARKLATLVEQGRILEAFDAFYADDVTMSENENPPTVGKAANRAREETYLGRVAQMHEHHAAAILTGGDQVAIHWLLDFTNTDGVRLRFDQIALQTWRNGEIIAEKFYYDPSALAKR